MLPNCKVSVVCHEAGILGGCKKCRRVLTEGNFCLGVEIDEKGKTFKYLIGFDPPLVCCGEKKTLIRAFKTEADAEKVQQELIEKMEQQRTTEGLPLLDWAIPENN